MFALFLLCLAADPAGTGDKPDSAAARVDFVRDIQPIFQARCYECHGPSAQKSGLRLDVRSALEGGDGGPLLKPGESAASALIERVESNQESERMPPSGNALSEKEIALLRAWIDQGANWPADQVVEVRPHSDHWSFQAPRPTVPPQVRNRAWVRNPIDRFVLSRLEKEGVAPAPEADRDTLLRRLYLDLVGLPPSPEERAQFLNDTADGAYERLVERLLASSHFGERWGRHWLDMARYADSNGYERDDVRPNAWRYRDWVIQAINDDLPYDRFVIEQLAGDLLPNATPSQMVATGFHRMTTTNTESGINKEDYRNREIVDRVNTTSSVLLGLTVGCAQCHSHKYDPLSQQDYYRLYGFFTNTDENDVDIQGTPDEIKVYEAALAAHEHKEKRLKFRNDVFQSMQKLGCDKWRDSLGEWAAQGQRQLAAIEKLQARGSENWSVDVPSELQDDLQLPEKYRTALAVPKEKRDHTQSKGLGEYFAGLDQQKEAVRFRNRPLREQLEDLEQSVDWTAAMLAEPAQRTDAQRTAIADFERSLAAKLDDLSQEIRHLAVERRYLPKPALMAFSERTAERRPTYVLLRGDFKQHGAEVQTGVPPVLHPLTPRGAQADRLDLANWIMDPANPVTSRVAVNQVWRHLFGRGIVASVDDFGTQGEKPSHPELLDWLAIEFPQRGWSRKELIRLIVTSATYRQSSAYRPELQQLDPLNTLLARQSRFRLEGEIVRDLCLAAGGLLHPVVGGPTVYPQAPESIRELAFKYKLVWATSSKPDCYRRGMYIHFKRSNPYPSLITFDCPEGNVCTTSRGRSNTPLQALVTLNDPVFIECAQALARRILSEPSSQVEDRLRFAGRLCLARELAPTELETLRALCEEELAAYEESPAGAAEFAGDAAGAGRTAAEAAAWTAVARTLLNLDEFVTRE